MKRLLGALPPLGWNASPNFGELKGSAGQDTDTFIFPCRNGSVIVDFTIVYNVSDYRWIEKLKQSISSTGLLYNMPLELEELTAENG